MPHKRSLESEARRDAKKVKHMQRKTSPSNRKQISFNPALTAADKKTNRLLPPIEYKIQEETDLVDTYKGVYFSFLKNIFPNREMLDSLWENYLEEALKTFSDRRGKREGVSLGFWLARGHYDKVYATPATKEDKGKEIIDRFSWLGEYVSKILSRNFPDMEKLVYGQIDKQYRPFGLFSLMMPFTGGSSSLHIDSNDVHGGFCCVVALGDFEGGELLLDCPEHQLRAVIEMKPGDLFFFRSHSLAHQNLSIIGGERKVIVFVSHNSLFNQQKVVNYFE